MAGAVSDVLVVDCALWSTLRSRADDDVDASSGRELNVADSDEWRDSNPGNAGPAGPDDSWIGRAGMSMCRRLIAGLNKSSLRSIGLSLTLHHVKQRIKRKAKA